MIWHKVLAFVGLALVALLIMRSLVRRDTSPTSRINLEDLLLGDDGRLSKVAVAFWGAFLITGWAFIYLTLRDKMTDGIFLAFGGMWVLPLTAKLIFNQAVMPSLPGAVTTTETATSKVTVTQPPEQEK